MENKKLLLQDLAGIIAAKENISKKKAEAFCRLIFDVIEEGLVKDKYTKIKGLGTFKLVPVSERESIDVNTGERIQISGYSKVAFTPDNMIKDLVNRPFAHFQTVVVNDEADIDELEYTEPEEEKAEEAESEPEEEVLAEEEKETQEPQEEKTEEEPREETTEEEEQTEQLPEEPEQTEAPAEPEQTETAEEPEQLDEEPQPEDEEPQPEEDESQPVNISVPYYAHGPIKYVWKVAKTIHRPNWWKICALTLFVLLLMALSYVAGYYKILCPPCGETLRPVAQQPVPAETKTAAPAPVDTTAKDNDPKPAPAPADTLKSGAAEAAEAKTQQTEQEQEPVTYSIHKKYRADGVLETYVVKKGDNLYKIARRVYGHKDFARYLIDYNHIKNPDNIGLGSKVKIPRLVPAE